MTTENEQAVLNEAFAYYGIRPNHFRECQIMEQLAAIIERRDKQIAELEKNFHNALDRIWDLLQQDDGQAYKEAERFYERHKPGE